MCKLDTKEQVYSISLIHRWVVIYVWLDKVHATFKAVGSNLEILMDVDLMHLSK